MVKIGLLYWLNWNSLVPLVDWRDLTGKFCLAAAVLNNVGLFINVGAAKAAPTQPHNFYTWMK